MATVAMEIPEQMHFKGGINSHFGGVCGHNNCLDFLSYAIKNIFLAGSNCH